MCRTCSRRQTELIARESELIRCTKKYAKVFEKNGMLTFSEADQIALGQVKQLEARRSLAQALATCPDKS